VSATATGGSPRQGYGVKKGGERGGERKRGRVKAKKERGGRGRGKER